MRTALPSPPRSAGVALQFCLGGLVLVAPYAPRAQTYRLYGIAILLLPAVLAHLVDLDLGAWQRGWVSLALAIHAFGALYALYREIWWYDHLAHVTSAVVVAGACYVVVRARGWRPTVGTHVAVFGAVLVLGVAWELWELHVDYLSVYGPTDSVLDVTFDAVGWLLAVPVRGSLVDTGTEGGPAGSDDR